MNKQGDRASWYIYISDHQGIENHLNILVFIDFILSPSPFSADAETLNLKQTLKQFQALW